VSATFITSFSTNGPGLRVAVKDLLDMAGVPTTAGSRVLADAAVPATADAVCLAGLRASGAQIVGRTNLHEIALGVTGINPWFGTPTNPLDPSLAPGGSSSGSAVAVGTGEATVAYGTDTGGSVRIPAACCGVCGLKTTWGRIPVEGVRPLSPSLDTVGPMAADVAGLVTGMQPEALRATSWEVSYVDPDEWRAATRWTATLLVAEAYQTNQDLLERYGDRISPDVARRLGDGRLVTPADITAATAGRAQWQAQLIALFGRFDLLVTPVLSILPPTLDRATDLLEGRYTLPVNLAGVPALALPVPTRAALPASIQLISASGTEERLLAAGAVIEAAVAA
jgi:amidase